jgi:homoserine dehydrogenase
MTDYNLVLLGFGNVGQAFARLLIRKRSEMIDPYNLSFRVTGIYTAHHGAAIQPSGLDLEQALAAVGRPGGSLKDLSSQPPPQNGVEFIQQCQGNVLFETSPVNYQTGEPAVTHLRTALQKGMHAITANKGPVVHACRQLTELANSKGLKFYFESTVMDGAPIFSLFRETLPAAQLLGFTAILNSTTNLILTRMEQGESMDAAIAYAQAIGVAETDPSGDVDGWDAAVKVAALVTVLMDNPIKPDQVRREGIRGLGSSQLQEARSKGMRWKLVCRAQRQGKEIEVSVKPELVEPASPLFNTEGTTSIAQFETDVLGLFSVVETDPGPETTAYGMLADFLNIVRVEMSSVKPK